MTRFARPVEYAEGLCSCGTRADHDGTECRACHDARWDFSPFPSAPIESLAGMTLAGTVANFAAVVAAEH